MRERDSREVERGNERRRDCGEIERNGWIQMRGGMYLGQSEGRMDGEMGEREELEGGRGRRGRGRRGRGRRGRVES